MSAISFQQMADRVAGLMEERLGIRGAGLTEKLRRGGRHLPRPIRAKARELAEIAEKARNPKLLMQIDPARAADCYDACLRYLTAQPTRSLRAPALIRVVTTVALGLLTLAAVILFVQRMQGRL